MSTSGGLLKGHLWQMTEDKGVTPSPRIMARSSLFQNCRRCSFASSLAFSVHCAAGPRTFAWKIMADAHMNLHRAPQTHEHPHVQSVCTTLIELEEENDVKPNSDLDIVSTGSSGVCNDRSVSGRDTFTGFALRHALLRYSVRQGIAINAQ